MYASASPLQNGLYLHKHLISCVDGWVGVVERDEGGKGFSAPCHTFQCEENKSICEVATGADCTFATGVCCVSPCASICACVCACWSHFGGWLTSFIDFWAVIGQLGSWALLLPKLGYTQTWTKMYSSLQSVFTNLVLSSENIKFNKTFHL